MKILIQGLLGQQQLSDYTDRLWLCSLIGILCIGLRAQAGEEHRLRILTYNIHHGEGTDGKVDYQRLSEMIVGLKPDLVAVQEVDKETSRVDGVDQAALLGQLTGMNVVFGAAMPFAGGHYGQAILSRFPIEDTKTYPLPFMFDQEPRALIEATVVPENGLPKLVFAGTHLSNVSGDTRVQQVKEIRKKLRGREDTPVILAGDFNARPGSSPMETMLGNDWIDATAPESVIDYILLRRQDGWRVREIKTVDDRIVSDHRPVLVELEWREDENRVGRTTPKDLEAFIELEEQLQDSISSVQDAIVAVNRGSGGGVIVSPDGYVLTAAHVSGYGRDVRIRLADGSNHRAKSLGAYRFADAAMVKIEGDGPFPYVSLAELEDTKVGDWCFAMGHPGGLDQSRGVVARLGRVITKKDNMMRTDSRILGGDSGCALFNSRGQLIGIHSRIGMPLDQNYHAPIDAFLRHWEDMKEGEVIPPEARRGRGGFGIQTADANPGVKVVKVSPEDSLLREGDIIRQFDEYNIEDDWEYLVALSSKKIDEVARLRVLRDKAWLELKVKVARYSRRNRE
jgi:endonuclease/exonuclease/phosphatase family metal-dependent hydrolase